MNKKFLSILLAAVLFFQPFIRVRVLAEEVTPEATPTSSPTPLPTPTPQSEINPAGGSSSTPSGEFTPQTASESGVLQEVTIINENQVEATNSGDFLAQTGENQASGSGVLIETGSATASADLVNVINTNLIGENFWQAIINLFGTSENDIDLTQIEGRENFDPNLISVANFLSSLAVYNTNTATLTNNLDLLASTGNNQILGDKGKIQTGSASASLNLFNLVNTNLTGQNWFFGVINLFGKLTGDMVLPYELQFLGEDEVAKAQPTLANTVEVSNHNEATLTNNVSVFANSGENEIVGSGRIQTGEASASANLLNIVNTNIFGSRWLLLTINNFGRWTGNLLGWWGNLTVTPGGTLVWVRLPPVEAEAKTTTSFTVENNNTATVENNISLAADSGNNQIEGESASIKTGEAQSSANIFNFVNTNITGNNWFFGIINIFDEFFGNIIFPRPDLTIAKAADKEVVLPGEEITYTINYKNQGRLWAKNTVITDTLPSGVSFVSASDGGTYQDGKVTWELGKVWPGQGGSLTLVVRVNPEVVEGTPLTNTVNISTLTEEPNKNNNSSSVTVFVSFIPIPSPTPTPSPSPSPSPSPGAPGSTEVSGVGGPSVSGPSNTGPVGGSPICPDTPPARAPALLSAVVGVNSVTLTWSKASDRLSYYLVAYGLSPGNYLYGNPNVGGLETTSYRVGNLSGGTTYYFVVRAGNGCAPGSFSNELSATPYGPSLEGLGFLPQVLGALIPQGLIGEALATEAAPITTTREVFRPSLGPISWRWIVTFGGGAILTLILYLLRHYR